jgi:hypothetical protein
VIEDRDLPMDFILPPKPRKWYHFW